MLEIEVSRASKGANVNKKRLLINILILFLVCIGLNAQDSKGFYEENDYVYYDGKVVTSILYQQDADIVRLRHLKYYGELIVEYYNKTGHYPLQDGSNIPKYIYVANRNQMEFTKDYDNAIPFKHETIDFKIFIDEIEKDLGHEIKEYYDPQEYPDVKWNWYLYCLEDDVFYFAIHVHQRFPFSKNIAPYFYKVEISNHSNRGKNLIVEVHELLNSNVFKQEVNRAVIIEEYFTEREMKYLHDSKQNE